jgi:hypothetical protein
MFAVCLKPVSECLAEVDFQAAIGSRQQPDGVPHPRARRRRSHQLTPISSQHSLQTGRDNVAKETILFPCCHEHIATRNRAGGYQDRARDDGNSRRRPRPHTKPVLNEQPLILCRWPTEARNAGGGETVRFGVDEGGEGLQSAEGAKLVGNCSAFGPRQAVAEGWIKAKGASE